MKRTVKTALWLCVASCMATGSASAAEETVYALDPVIVTATRYGKEDLDIPATTQVITGEQMQDMGAVSVEQALRFATGIVYKVDNGVPRGGEFLIRGKRRGTLVMVDGVSINFRNGYASLDSIPVDDVERVEIIRGGGAVMYGTDAIGGVINIITKKKKNNSVTLSAGNLDRQHHGVEIGTDTFGLGFHYEKLGRIENTSSPSRTAAPLDSKFFHFLGSERYTTVLTGNLTDHLRWRTSYAYYDNGRSYNYANKPAPSPYDHRHSISRDLQSSLQYDKDGLFASLSYHQYHLRTVYDYYNYKSKESAELLGLLDKQYRSNGRDRLLSLDVHKEWQQGEDTVILGVSAEHNTYMSEQEYKPSWDTDTGVFTKYVPSSEEHYSRNVYSLYGSYERELNQENTIILSARQTWTGASPGETEFHEFTPQVQYLYKPAKDWSFFASYGESFALPTMTDLYGKGQDVGNPDLKPETGKHYEIGTKYISGKALWKLSLFRSDVKNFMRLKTDKKTGENYAQNEDTKNRGLELSVEIRHGDAFSSTWGIVVQNPLFYDTSKSKPSWQRDYGRLQFNGGITWKHKKWTASFFASYLGQRVLSSYQEEVKPLLMSSFHASYAPNAECEIFFDADNVLDRHVLVGHVSSLYWLQPFSFLAGVKYKF